MSNNQLRNVSIDTARILCAFFVVSLHTKFKPSFAAPFVADFAKIAVPFFLMVSGFHLYRNSRDDLCRAIIRSLKSTAIVLVEALLVYSAFKLSIKYYFNKNLFGEFDAINFLLFNDPGFTEHLWYLFAYIYAAIAIYFIVKFSSPDKFFYCAVMFLTLHVLVSIGDKFNDRLNYKAWHELNWIVTGIPFLLIGMYVKKNFNIAINLEKRKIIYGIFAAIVLIFVEHFIFKKFIGRGPGVISVVVLSTLIFIYCVRDFGFFNTSVDNILSKMGNNYSLSIYVYHVLVRDVMGLFSFLSPYNNTVCVFFVTLTLAISIKKLKILAFYNIKSSKVDLC